MRNSWNKHIQIRSTLSWNNVICCLQIVQITALFHLTWVADSRRKRQEHLRVGCRLRSCFASFCNKHTTDVVPAFQNRKTYVELHMASNEPRAIGTKSLGKLTNLNSEIWCHHLRQKKLGSLTDPLAGASSRSPLALFPSDSDYDLWFCKIPGHADGQIDAKCKHQRAIELSNQRAAY
jgi:hypothetical protein